MRLCTRRATAAPAQMLISVSQDIWLGGMVVAGFAAALLLFAAMG